MKNNYIQTNVQKEFTPGMTGTYEHTAQLAYIIRQAKKKQRSLVVPLLNLKNAFGDVHHNLIPVVLDYHHVPSELIECIMSLYKDFAKTVVTDSYTTSFLRIERGVLQGDCLNPLIFNLLINTFTQYVRQGRFSQLGYLLSKLLRPIHCFQFADDAAIATGQVCKTQELLNSFTPWCTWSSMIIRVDKCHTFGMTKKETLSVETHPKLFVNNEQIPALKNNESFKHLGRYFNFEMDNEEHKKELLDITNKILNKVDTLPLHPKHKLDIYLKYYMSKTSWHLTIADIPNIWKKQHLDTTCHNKI